VFGLNTHLQRSGIFPLLQVGIRWLTMLAKIFLIAVSVLFVAGQDEFDYEGDMAVFDADEVAAALSELSDDELTALQQELDVDAQNLALQEEDMAALTDEQVNELAALAVEDEAALFAAMSSDQQTATTTSTASSSTPVWAIGLIVLGVLVGFALVIVQVQLVALFRKRLPSAPHGGMMEVA